MITITISSGTTSVTSAVSIATNYVVEGSGAGRQQWRRAEDLKDSRNGRNGLQPNNDRPQMGMTTSVGSGVVATSAVADSVDTVVVYDGGVTYFTQVKSGG